MRQSGCPSTSLPQKLGMKDGLRVVFCVLFDSLRNRTTAAGLAAADIAELRRLPGAPRGPVYLFAASVADLAAALPTLTEIMTDARAIWVSWPKKSAKVPIDITEDRIRVIAPSGRLADIKVCAVGVVWSGLKPVTHKEMRA
jgi:hypothetical protein